MSSDRPHPPSLQRGRYHLIHLIGTGGHAEVYRAIDTRLKVPRAIKILDSADTKRFHALQIRLRAEAQALARIRHPNVIAIHDIGTDGAHDYVVMDLAEGGSVSQWMEVHGPVPVEVAIEWMLDVLSALAASHSASIVHRDVKPANILLDADGRPLLADFGIALLGDGDVRRTSGGVAMGSVQYMPPEQRVDAAAVDHRADIYSAGATLYAMITAKTPADLFIVEDADDPRWSGLPAGVADVIRQACAMRPAERYASAGAMADALLLAIPGFERRPPIYPPPRPPPKDRPEVPPILDAWTVMDPGRRRRWRWWVGGALAVILIGLAGFIGGRAARLYFREDAPREAKAEPPSLLAVPPAPISAPPSGLRAAPVPAPPAPAERPVAPAIPARPPPFGTWRLYPEGSGAVEVTLVLGGAAEAIAGRITSRLADRAEIHPVTGTFDAYRRVLALREDGGVEYALTLAPDLRSGEGTFAWDGKIRFVTLTWKADR